MMLTFKFYSFGTKRDYETCAKVEQNQVECTVNTKCDSKHLDYSILLNKVLFLHFTGFITNKRDEFAPKQELLQEIYWEY